MRFIVTFTFALALVTTAAAGPKLRRIPPRDVAAMQAAGKTVVFLDARGGGSDGIPKAVPLAEDDVDAWAATADKTAIYVAYCACPADQSAVHVAHRLGKLGFTSAYVLKGGLKAWWDHVRERNAGTVVAPPLSEQ